MQSGGDRERERDDRLQIVSETARAFAEATTDPQRLLETVAHRVADALGDYCAVLMISADGTQLIPSALFVPDPAAMRQAEDALSEPLELARHPAARGVLDGEPFLARTLDLEQLRPPRTPQRYFDFCHEIGFHSMLMVPLRVQGRSLGELVLARYRPESPGYDERDVRFAQLLADHAALAIASSRMYAAETAARTAAELARDQLRETELSHRRFFEASPMPMFVFDIETEQMLETNDATLAVCGYTREEFLRLRLTDLRHPDDAAMLAVKMAAVGDRSTSGPARYRHRDGSTIHVEGWTSTSPFAGHAARFVAMTDVTERLRGEQQRRAAETRFARLAESGMLGILVTDLEGRVFEINDAALAMVGYTRGEILAETFRWTTLTPPEWQTDLHDQTQLLVGAGMMAPREKEYLRRDGSRVSAMAGAALLDEGKCLVVVMDLTGREWAEAAVAHLHEAKVSESRLLRDITERRRTETALKLANQELEAFSYSVAHDLRAPLRGMNGFANILLEEYGHKLDADGREYLGEILFNTERMGELIDAMLSLSRLTRSELQKERVNLSAIVRASTARLSASEPERRVEVVIEDDLHVEVDLLLARALIENLVGNAWKFTNRTPVARIEFGLTESRAFFIRDNGAGFDMAYAEKLFAPFQRLHTVVEFPGTGIGLATVQRIVQRHAGEIWAEGSVGSGATFYFTIGEPRS
jgi:PAS domain S-box-containing protein